MNLIVTFWLASFAISSHPSLIISLRNVRFFVTYSTIDRLRLILMFAATHRSSSFLSSLLSMYLPLTSSSTSVVVGPVPTPSSSWLPLLVIFLLLLLPLLSNFRPFPPFFLSHWPLPEVNLRRLNRLNTCSSSYNLRQSSLRPLR